MWDRIFILLYVYHIIEEEKQGKTLPMFWEKKDGE